MVHKHLLAPCFNIRERGARYADLLGELILGLAQIVAQNPDALTQASINLRGIHAFLYR